MEKLELLIGQYYEQYKNTLYIKNINFFNSFSMILCNVQLPNLEKKVPYLTIDEIYSLVIRFLNKKFPSLLPIYINLINTESFILDVDCKSKYAYTKIMNNKRMIVVPNWNNLLTALNIVHEFNHYLNAEETGWNSIASFLTEGLSISFEIEFLDYLKEYENYDESFIKDIKLSRLEEAKENSFDVYFIGLLISFYESYKSIKYENIKEFIDDEKLYNEYCIYILKKYKTIKDINAHIECNKIFGIFLSFYKAEVNSEERFIKLNRQLLNNNINCLNEIDLDINDENFIKVLSKSLLKNL